jgi:hypothetical protein
MLDRHGDGRAQLHTRLDRGGEPHEDLTPPKYSIGSEAAWIGNPLTGSPFGKTVDSPRPHGLHERRFCGAPAGAR